MASFDKISAQQARQDVESKDALLVCGYDESSKWEQYRVPDAESFAEFRRHADKTPHDREIIFYCA